MSLIPDGNETTETTEPATETTTETTETTEPATETTYKYAEGVDATGDIPDWFKKDKYDSVAAQAEAYPELEKKFGSFTGTPKDGYVLDGVNIDESPLLKLTAEWGAENQLSNEGLESLVTKVNELAQQQIDEDAASVKEQLGNTADKRLGELSQWGKNNLSPDEFTQFQGLAQTAGQVEVLEKLIGMSKNSKIVNVEAQQPNNDDVEAKLKEMQLAVDPVTGKRKTEVDPEYRKDFQKKMNDYYNK